MATYIRARIPGGTYFFTVVTRNRYPLFQSPLAIDAFRQAYRAVSAKYPLRTEAIVLLPDHIHAIWTLPPGDDRYSLRWQLIKANTTRKLRKVSDKFPQELWQPRYWEHWIRDPADLRAHMDYIAYNPVKHGFVSSPWYWPHGTFRRLVARGVYSRDWGITEPPGTRNLDLE